MPATDHEAALLSLIGALWRELAKLRDDPDARISTHCFDHGAPSGPVRDAVIDCCGQGLSANMARTVGIAEVARRLPDFESSLRAAWRKDRDTQARPQQASGAPTCGMGFGGMDQVYER